MCTRVIRRLPSFQCSKAWCERLPHLCSHPHESRPSSQRFTLNDGLIAQIQKTETPTAATEDTCAEKACCMIAQRIIVFKLSLRSYQRTSVSGRRELASNALCSYLSATPIRGDLDSLLDWTQTSVKQMIAVRKRNVAVLTCLQTCPIQRRLRSDIAKPVDLTIDAIPPDLCLRAPFESCMLQTSRVRLRVHSHDLSYKKGYV